MLAVVPVTNEEYECARPMGGGEHEMGDARGVQVSDVVV